MDKHKESFIEKAFINKHMNKILLKKPFKRAETISFPHLCNFCLTLRVTKSGESSPGICRDFLKLVIIVESQISRNV